MHSRTSQEYRRLPNLLWCGIASFLLFCSTGATCIPKGRSPLAEFQPPVIWETPPSLYQIADVVNRTDKVRQLQSPAVTVRFPGLPALSTNLDWRRDRDFRMQGSVTRLTGVDFDIGSNPEIFWMSSKHDVTPTLYFARHDQFESQLNRQILPVSPLWVMEGLGFIHIDPDTVAGLPQIASDGLVRVNSTIASQTGNYQRTVLVDGKLGIVREVMLQDPTGRLLAKAMLSKHQPCAEIDGFLPYQSDIEFIPVGGQTMNLKVEVGFYRINENANISDSRFANPDPAGFKVENLVELNAGGQSTVAMPGYQNAQGTYQPQYRGVP